MGPCTYTELVSNWLDGELAGKDIVFITDHLSHCSECQDFYSFHKKVDQSISEYLFFDRKHKIINVHCAKEIGFSQDTVENIQEKSASLKKIVLLLVKIYNNLVKKEQLTKIEEESFNILKITISIVVVIGAVAIIYNLYKEIMGKDADNLPKKKLNKKEKQAILYDIWAVAYILSESPTEKEIAKAYDTITPIQRRLLVA